MLATISVPATGMSTVQEILRRVIKFLSLLQLERIPVALEQTLFAEATGIAWSYPRQYERTVFRMGNFHNICSFMSTIEKIIEVRLRDAVVEASVVAEKFPRVGRFKSS